MGAAFEKLKREAEIEDAKKTELWTEVAPRLCGCFTLTFHPCMIGCTAGLSMCQVQGWACCFCNNPVCCLLSARVLSSYLLHETYSSCIVNGKGV